MALPMPTISQGLENLHRFLNRMGANRDHPHDCTTYHKVLLRLKNLCIGL